VKRGVQEASGDNILFMDADLLGPHCAMCTGFLMRWRKGADIAVGSRALKDSKLNKEATIAPGAFRRLSQPVCPGILSHGVSGTRNARVKLFRASKSAGPARLCSGGDQRFCLRRRIPASS